MPSPDLTKGRTVLHEACGQADAEEIGEFREVVYTAWTVVSTAKRGDLLVLYEKGALKWFAFGRVLCDAVRSEVQKRRFWAYVEVFPVCKPVGLPEMRRAAPEWNGISSQPQRQTVPPRSARKLLRRMVAQDPVAERLLDRWASGRRWWRVPEEDLAELAQASWSPADRPPPKQGSELHLQQQIEDYLINSKRARRLREQDGVALRGTFYMRHDDGGFGFADRVLVDLTRPRTLLIVEVKKDAKTTPKREPVMQVIRYRASLRKVARGWKLRPVAICLSHTPGVEDLARRRRIELWQFRPKAHKKRRVVYKPPSAS